MNLYPYRQSETKPGIRLLDSAERDRFVNEINSFNKILGNDTLFERAWKEFLAGRRNHYRSNILGLNRYVGFAARKFPFLFRLFEARNKRVILNLIRCDAHREVLVELLSDHQ